MESDKIYRYRYDRRVIILTTLYTLLLAVVGISISMFSAGDYFFAWFTSIIGAVVALMIISIPRKITLNEESVTINCILEIAEIPLEEIVSVSKVEPRDRRWVLPIFASFGFFGYFGYYLDWRTLEKVVVYATDWQNMIEIINIYDDRYYISCRDADQFIEDIDSYFERSEDEVL